LRDFAQNIGGILFLASGKIRRWQGFAIQQAKQGAALNTCRKKKKPAETAGLSYVISRE